MLDMQRFFCTFFRDKKKEKTSILKQVLLMQNNDSLAALKKISEVGKDVSMRLKKTSVIYF